MEIYREKYLSYWALEIKEKNREDFYKDGIKVCYKSCINFLNSDLTINEKLCLKNCSTKYFSSYLNIYKDYIPS